MVTDPDPQSFVVHDDGNVVYADGMFLTLVDADAREQVVGSPLSAFVAPEFHDAVATQVRRVREGEAPALGLTLTLRTTTGDRREVVALTSRVEWEGETALQTSFLNVTGDAPGEGMRLRDYAMEEAPIGITMADITRPEEPLIYVNDGFVSLTGYPREEVLGQNCRFLQGEGTREAPVARMREAIENRDPVTVELRNYRKDGTMFWNRVSIVPVESAAGSVDHYLGFQEDITDMKLYEHEKTLFRQQAEVADQAMFITDREGTIQYVNAAFERTTGYPAAEAVGRNPRILKSGQQDEAFYENLWETITAGEIWEAELTNRTKDGELYEAKQTIVPVTDSEGTVTHFAAIESDITEQVLRRQTLNVLNRVLRHNLRTAITVIDGQTELLAADDGGVDPETAITAIRNQTDSMRKIADKTARINALWESEDRGAVWDGSHLESLVASYREEYPDATIDLTVSVTDRLTLPDAELFEFAFDEAVENAVGHSDRDHPHLDITVETADTPGHARITLADDGPGIPDNERQAIESGREVPLTHGTGIGLWIIEWVTTSLGGEFTIAENDPRGTVLSFTLPLVSDSSG